MQKIAFYSFLIAGTCGILNSMIGAPWYIVEALSMIIFPICFFGFTMMDQLEKISKKLGIEDEAETKDEKAAVVVEKK